MPGVAKAISKLTECMQRMPGIHVPSWALRFLMITWRLTVSQIWVISTEQDYTYDDNSETGEKSISASFLTSQNVQ